MNRVRAALLSLLVGYFAHPGASAQEHPGPRTSASQPTAQFALHLKPPADYSQESIVVNQYFTSVRFETSGASETRLNTRIRIQDDDAAPSEAASLISPPHSP